MAKTRGKPRKDRKYPTPKEGIHRAYYIAGTDELAIAVKSGGVMVWRDKDGNDVETELRQTGVKCGQRAN